MQRAVDLYLDMGSTVNQAGSSDTAGASTAVHSGMFHDEVREAIPARYDQLIGGSQGPYESMQGWLHGNANIPSLAELEAQAVQEEFEEAGLGSLYKPPDDLNAGGSLQDAMKKAKDAKKWLLVNIQAADEFASHVLNRDIWSHETVKEVIRSSFVFWQREKGSVQGSPVVTNYNIVQFPSVLIIDPRTGRKLKLWTSEKLRGPLSVTDLLSDFMGENPYYVASSAALTSTSSGVSSTPDVVEVIEAPLAFPTQDMAESNDAEAIKVAIRLTNGQKKLVSFKGKSRITCVKQWVSFTENLAPSKFEIRLSHPPKVVAMDGSLTVQDAGIAGALLVVVALISS